MTKLFKWIYKPSGNCPVQAEGYFLGYYFYFRARHTQATIEFYKDETFFYKNNYIKRFILKTTPEYRAGWLSKRYCKWLIFKGCFLFLRKL